MTERTKQEGTPCPLCRKCDECGLMVHAGRPLGHSGTCSQFPATKSRRRALCIAQRTAITDALMLDPQTPDAVKAPLRQALAALMTELDTIDGITPETKAVSL